MWPSLVLGPSDHAYVVWTQNLDMGGGCAGIDPGPRDGTYFATDATGQWVTTRLTRTPGESAITFEPSTGRIDVITHDFDGGGPLTYRTSSDGTDWTAAPISDTRELTDPVIRVDPATNRLVVLAISWSDEMPGIVLLTLS